MREKQTKAMRTNKQILEWIEKMLKLQEYYLVKVHKLNLTATENEIKHTIKILKELKKYVEGNAND